MEWIKERKIPKRYGKTKQQEKIAEAGRKIKIECSGKKGDEFHKCRMEVIKEVFEEKL